MDDLISRQAAIKALYDYWSGSSFDGDGYYIADRSEDVINDLLSAESERKRGVWIHKPDIYLDEQTWECSECGEPWIFIEGTPSENNANFCPNCGADMREESEAEE